MYKNKKVAIIGFGREGLASANFLKNSQISIFDDQSRDQIEKDYFSKLQAKNVEFYFKGSKLKNLKFDLVIRSPGVRPDHSLIKKLVKNGAVLTSGTKIFFDLCPAKIIGVTGTKGKGTTATLIYQILKTVKKKVYLAGNIGLPSLEILPKVKKEDIVILELSSFQLMDLKKSPHIAVVLMITSEHLDWHRDDKEYAESKEPLLLYQKAGDFAVINADYQKSQDLSKITKARVLMFSKEKITNGAYLENNKIVSQVAGFEEICSIGKILLPGRHNLENAMAAALVAKIFKVENKNIVKVLASFRGLIHRLQYLGEVKNTKFFNDSYSTIPETTIAAIEAVIGPKILILGGSSKGSDFSRLAEKVTRDSSIKGVVLVGVEAKKIKEAVNQSGRFSGKISEGAKNMHEIVNLAFNMCHGKENVILSPACASFDMFKNYEDRGQKFIGEVEKLKNG